MAAPSPFPPPFFSLLNRAPHPASSSSSAAAEQQTLRPPLPQEHRGDHPGGGLPSTAGDHRAGPQGAPQDQGAPSPSEDAAKARRGKIRLPGASRQLPEDGYSWLKYGHKNILGNTFSRAYYRCAKRSEGCQARKTVDFPLSETKELCITYDGPHNHTATPCAVDPRTVVVVRRKGEEGADDGLETGGHTKHAHRSGKPHSVGNSCLAKPKDPGWVPQPAVGRVVGGGSSGTVALAQGPGFELSGPGSAFWSPPLDRPPRLALSPWTVVPPLPKSGTAHVAKLSYVVPNQPQELPGLRNYPGSVPSPGGEDLYSAYTSPQPGMADPSKLVRNPGAGVVPLVTSAAGCRRAEVELSSTSEHGSSEHSPEVRRPIPHRAGDGKPLLSLLPAFSRCSNLAEETEKKHVLSSELSSLLAVSGGQSAVNSSQGAPLRLTKRRSEGNCMGTSEQPAKKLLSSLGEDLLGTASWSGTAQSSGPDRSDSIQFCKLQSDPINEFEQWSTLDVRAWESFARAAGTQLPGAQPERELLGLDLTLRLSC